MGWDAGWELDLKLPTTEAVILEETPITINGIKGKKLIVSYKWLPQGNKCPRYRLENKGVVYDIGLYECLESDILEDVVKSFRVIMDKN